MRLGLITALAVVVSDTLSEGSIIRTTGHAVSRTARRIMQKEGNASDLSETLCGTTTLLLAGHLFDSVMES